MAITFRELPNSKTIRIGMSGDHLLLPVYTIDRISMFHTDHSVKSAQPVFVNIVAIRF